MERTEAHEVLGLDASATAADRDEAFRRLALRAHPDAGGDAASFARLVRARDELQDRPPSRRPAHGAPAVVVPDVPRWRSLLEALGWRRPPSGPRRVV